MANYQILKADIDEKIYENAQQKITGENLNSVLNAMVATLGAEYQFAGVATIDTNPETSDAKVFYIANGKGRYTYFGGVEVTESDVVILYYDTSWHKVSTGIASQERLTELETEVSEIKGGVIELEGELKNGIVNAWGVYVDTDYHHEFRVDGLGKTIHIKTNSTNQYVELWALYSSTSINDAALIARSNTNPSIIKEANIDLSQYPTAKLLVIANYNASDISSAEYQLPSKIEELETKNAEQDSAIELTNQSIENLANKFFALTITDATKTNYEVVDPSNGGIRAVYQQKRYTSPLPAGVSKIQAQFAYHPTVQLGWRFLDVDGRVLKYGNTLAISDSDNGKFKDIEVPVGATIFENSHPISTEYGYVVFDFEGINVPPEYNLPKMQDDIDQLKEDIYGNLEILIPDVVYAIVDTELNIWNDTISLSMDNGLVSPMNYRVVWSCSVGMYTDRAFRFKPKTSQVGSYSCKCTMLDVKGKILATKTFIIKVVAKNALSVAKKIVYFGDSLGYDGASQLHANFNDGTRYTGVIPTMCGTFGTTFKYEANGGYKWSDFATKGAPAFRVYVSGIGSVSLNAVYSNSGHNFVVKEVNIDSGAGNGNMLLLTEGGADYNLETPDGVLMKVSGAGDNSIPYTGAFKLASNPLWNETTNTLDIAQYKERCGLQSTDKFDAVSFQLGINDIWNTLENTKNYIISLYNAFIADNPNCKFIIGLTTQSGNTCNGFGALSAETDWWNQQKHIYNIKKLYLELANTYPNIRIASPNLNLDRYYGFGFATRNISDRYAVSEKYHENAVHPITSGYQQIADAYLATYVAVLTE